MKGAGDRPRQALILAGGRGERMRPFTDTIPKHMMPFHGRPFLAYLIEMLAGQGFERVLMLLGYMPDATRDYFGCGRGFGVRIDYHTTPVDWQTAWRLRGALPMLEAHFLLAYCDNIWPLPFDRAWEYYLRSGRRAQMTVYQGVGGSTRSNVKVSSTGVVELYDPSRSSGACSGVDIGFLIADREAMAILPDANEPFERLLYPEWVRRGWLGAFGTRHSYYGVGRPEQLAETAKYLGREPVVLLDRDGVLNRRRGRGEYVRSWADWEWEPGALEALRMWRENGWRVAVVSNQAGIGRQVLTERDLAEIHNQMRREAEAAGGKIDAIYYCPHDWHAGCSCRKPEPGMLYRAQTDMHADLSRTFFVGDDERDRLAADAAGCRFVMAAEGSSLAKLAAQLIEMETQTCAY